MFCNSPDFTQPDPAERKKEVERTREMFRVTAELGGKFCRVLSGRGTGDGLLAQQVPF